VASSKRTALLHDAIRKALASLELLPDNDESRRLWAECVSLERVATDWSQSPPTPEERETAMRKVVALHVAIARVRRESQRPPSSDRGPDDG
jgi:hypothetical protein